MKKLIILFLSLTTAYCLLPACSFAQQLPLSNQYTLNKFSLSPAYAGTGEAFEILGSFRNEWMNVAGAPDTKIISANGIVCKNMGVGGILSSHSEGVFQNLSASVSYAYHLKFGGMHNLSFGLGLGLLESRANFSGASDLTDPVIANNTSIHSMGLDASFGILYRFKGLSVGISNPRIPSRIKNDNGKLIYSTATQQSFNIGYKYFINSDWAIDPIAKVSFVNGGPTFYEVAIPVMYKQKIWITPIYKKTDMAFGIGGIPYSNFIAQYTYEFSSKGIMGESGGTHEITIGWRMSKKKADAPAPDSKKPYYEWLNK